MTTLVSLCTGYGGLDLGLALAVGPLEHLCHAEIDRDASKVLRWHWPEVLNVGDIRNVPEWVDREPDWLTAGYPCQPFSQAGQRRGHLDERHLWPEVAKVIGRVRPRNILLENVRNHVRIGLGDVLADLANLGYDATWGVVRASDAGACHRRERLFILAAYARGERRSRRPGSQGTGRHEAVWSETGGAARDGSHPLLPTPRATDRFGVGAHGDGGLDLRTAVSLLPTPRVRDHKGRPNPCGIDLNEAVALLPTPVADHSGGLAQPGTDFSSLPNAVLSLLPTPKASDGTNGGPNQADGAGNPYLPAAVQPGRFGKYTTAVCRHEQVFGRLAPDPTVPAPRGGRRLNPVFVGWMMGLPDGWVTGTPGLSHNAALRILGNGVVPAQAALALRLLAPYHALI